MRCASSTVSARCVSQSEYYGLYLLASSCISFIKLMGEEQWSHFFGGGQHFSFTRAICSPNKWSVGMGKQRLLLVEAAAVVMTEHGPMFTRLGNERLL